MTSKLPLAWAAQVFAQICDDVDGATKIDEFLKAAFDDARCDLAESVDRRIAFDRWCKEQVAAAEEGYRWYRARKEMIERVHGSFRERTKDVVDSQPDVVFQGRLGKIWVQNNPPTVEYTFGAREAITPEVAEAFGVPSEYLVAKTTYRVDSERTKAELQAGEELGWATVRQGRSIRFPAVRKTPQTAIESAEA